MKKGTSANKRNGRNQKIHLQIARATRDILHPEGWQNKDGRPKGSGTAAEKVRAWREEHPEGTKAQCNRDTKLAPKTIRKW